ncbi:ATP-binding protein [Urbifossiella limnaea]|uniref:histidine kinase n=1 Tax=Urbifossiella limnaea TaxID=2528023 RepID=A0A517XRI3_9BACT|nr:ATP-binding protein [Urbifossiella limnaea]QDU20121.1 Wide host range VirA protein [Urbifossiella limnaea]
MTTPGFPAALAYLPSWWQDAAEPSAFDALLAGWVRACGWRAAGFVWAAESGPAVVRVAPTGFVSDAVLPQELPEVLTRLRGGEATAFVATAHTAGRVYAPVQFPGRVPAVLWAERAAGQTWSDADHAYIALAGKALERSPAAAALVGPVVDADRLEQRLADAAVVAGRMAHDFDNILTGIIGYSDLAAPLLPAGSQAQSFVAEIAKVGQRGIAFTQQLHSLSRAGHARPNPGSVVATLGREEARLRPLMHPNLRFEKDLPSGLPAVAVEAALLQTALGHLLENAVEACPQGGLVRVAARAIDLSAADARGYLGKAEAGPHVIVVVTDTGTGIKPEVRRRLIAEPFFTTKVRHRGLGLAVAFRILSAHRGGVQLDPAPPPGSGTVARVVLPLAAHRAPVASTTPPPAHPTSLADAVRPHPHATSRG